MKVGVCRICGKTGKLTKEHIPPKGAYNKGDYYISKVNPLLENRNTTKFEELIEFDITKSTKKQGGIGFYTLCRYCNNNTGGWYGKAYVDWIQQTINHLRTPYIGKVTVTQTQIFPLRIIKQIVAMFFSLNHESFRVEFPSLVNFILHKENTKLDDRIRVFAYYMEKGSVRYLANNFIGHIAETKVYHVSEIAFPPIGFVICLNNDKPATELKEITWFSSYNYDEYINYEQQFNFLPTYLQVPCDYRSEVEIRESLKVAENSKIKIDD